MARFWSFGSSAPSSPRAELDGAEPALAQAPIASADDSADAAQSGGLAADGEDAPQPSARAGGALRSVKAKRLFGLAAAGLAAALLAAGVRSAVDFAKTSPYFSLTRLEMRGDSQKVPLARVKEAVEGVVNGNYFTADLGAVREAVLTVPWVQDAAVRRVWPNGIEVDVEVYRAMALYEDGRLVSSDGALFSANPEEAPEASDLPNFYGAPSEVRAISRRYQRFSKIVSIIPAKITDVTLSDRGSWAIVMQSDSIPPTKIELGQEEKLDARALAADASAKPEADQASDPSAPFAPQGPAEVRLERIAQSYGLLMKLMKGPPSSIDARYDHAIAAGAPDQQAWKAYLASVEKARKVEEDQNSPVYNPEPDGDEEEAAAEHAAAPDEAGGA